MPPGVGEERDYQYCGHGLGDGEGEPQSGQPGEVRHSEEYGYYEHRAAKQREHQ